MSRSSLLGGAGMAMAVLLAASAPGQAQAGAAGVRRFAPPPSIELVHEGHSGTVQASGTVNAVDPAHRRVNLSHGSIKALGWPAMTMDFPVAAGVDLAALKPGMRVNFTLVHGPGGGMVVDAIRPASSRTP